LGLRAKVLTYIIGSGYFIGGIGIDNLDKRRDIMSGRSPSLQVSELTLVLPAAVVFRPVVHSSFEQLLSLAAQLLVPKRKDWNVAVFHKANLWNF
jgi:hypothetical protein